MSCVFNSHVQAAGSLASSGVLADMAAPSSMEPVFSTGSSSSNDPPPSLNAKGGGKGKGKGDQKGEGKPKKEKKDEQISRTWEVFVVIDSSGPDIDRIPQDITLSCTSIKPYYKASNQVQPDVPKASAGEPARSQRLAGVEIG